MKCCGFSSASAHNWSNIWLQKIQIRARQQSYLIQIKNLTNITKTKIYPAKEPPKDLEEAHEGEGSFSYVSLRL